jgi:hypothetical protein
LLTELGGCNAAEGIGWSVLDVVDHEAPGGFADVFEAGEQMDVEDFLAVGPVEALDVGVLVRLAGLDLLDGHTVRFRPLHKRIAEQLRPVVHLFLLCCGARHHPKEQRFHLSCGSDIRNQL